jgi:class 3 adenylate cyclase
LRARLTPAAAAGIAALALAALASCIHQEAPEAAPVAAPAAPQGPEPQVRIGLHASDATQVAGDFRGKGVHEASRIAALGGAGDIVASAGTVGDTHRTSGRRSETLKGISMPVEVVNVDWR